MDEEKLKKAADLLKDASDVLLSVRNNSNSNTTSRTSPTIAPGSVAETLLRARSMMQTSSNSGLYRRLNRNERLRAATASTVSAKNKKSKSKPVEKKPFEFALLRANSEESDEEGEIETLRKEKIIESKSCSCSCSPTDLVILPFSLRDLYELKPQICGVHS